MADERVNVISADGRTVSIPASGVEDALARGWRVETPEEATAVEEAEFYDRPVQKLTTAAEGLLRGVTFGGSDVVLPYLGAAISDRSADALRAEMARRREHNAWTAGLSSLAGVLVPGGAGALVARAGKGVQAAVTGTRAVKAAATGGLAARTLASTVPTIARGGVEGALLGAGEGVSELALSEDDLTAERLVAQIGGHALYGAGVGAGVGVGIKGLEGVARGGRGLARALARRAQRAEVPTGAIPGAAAEIPADLAALDRAGLRTAKTEELARIETERAAERAAAAEEIGRYHAANKETWPGLATEDKEIRKILRTHDNKLRWALDNPAGLAERPGQVLDTLQRGERALQRLVDESAPLRAKLEASAGVRTEAERLLEEIDAVIPRLKAGEALQPTEAFGERARIWRDWRGKTIGDAAADARLTDLQRVTSFRRALVGGKVEGVGDVMSARAAALTRAEEALAQNRQLQARLKALAEPPASARLDAIAHAGDVLAGGAAPPSLAQRLVQGGAFVGATSLAAPLGWAAPLVGAAVAKQVGQWTLPRVAGAVNKIAGGAGARVSGAIDRFLGVAERAAPTAARGVTAMLAQARFAPSTPRDERPEAGEPMAHAPARHQLYRDRERELLAQTTPDPTGLPRMRLEPRRALHDRLTPLRQHAPLLADRIESAAVRRLEYLATKLPKRMMPLAPGGPDTWRPSEFALASFARTAAAVEDPLAVVERLADGTVTPEDAEAVRATAPALYADIQAQIYARLGELRTTLPYKQRLALSIFTGAPVDPALRPEILALLQGSFASEPGTDSGQAPPQTRPALGSIKNHEEPTPAQERAG